MKDEDPTPAYVIVDGEPIAAFSTSDNETSLTPAQVAERFGGSASAYACRWYNAWGFILEDRRAAR